MKKQISGIAIILCLLLIFLFSSMPGSISVGTTKNFVHTALDKVNVVAKNELTIEKESARNSLFNQIHYIFRKSLHFSEYMLLAILVLLFLSNFNLSILTKLPITLFACSLYALTDEFHQYFVPNRTALFSDCLIDTLGALVGCVLFILIASLLNKKKSITS